MAALFGAGGAGAAAGATLGATAAGGLAATALGSMAAPTAGAMTGAMAAPAAASAIPAATITSPALTVTPQIASQTTGGLGDMMMDAMKSSINPNKNSTSLLGDTKEEAMRNLLRMGSSGQGSQIPGLIPTQGNTSRIEKRRMF